MSNENLKKKEMTSSRFSKKGKSALKEEPAFPRGGGRGGKGIKGL